MREISALSPTSVMLYERDPILWYLRYCADERLPRTVQSQPAAVGSAFDAMIKSLLYAQFHPDERITPEHPYSAVTLLNKQVEAPNRDWATRAGLHCLDQYSQSGALAELLLSVTALPELPKFEFHTRDVVSLDGLDVPIVGIPDMSFRFGDYSTLAILDWKVNGFCSKTLTTPAAGYIICRDGWRYDQFVPSRSANKAHPKTRVIERFGIRINEMPLEEINEEWATQTATYAWLLGMLPRETDFICSIEQLCGNPVGTEFPNLRIASFKNQVSRGFQETLIGKYVTCWHAYKTGHIFHTESREASDDLCKQLEHICYVLMRGDPASQAWDAAINFISGRNVYDLYHDYRAEILAARGLAPQDITAPGLIKGQGLINLAAKT